jgi:hypothetical protein
MDETLTCPKCGRSGRLPRGTPLVSVKCKGCGTRIAIGARPERTEGTPDIPWYRDTYIRASIAFALLVLVLFVSFLAWDGHRTRARQDLLSLKDEGTRLESAGDLQAADKVYQNLETQGDGWDDPDIRDAVRWAVDRRSHVQDALNAQQAARDREAATRDYEARLRSQLLAALGRALNRAGLSLQAKPPAGSGGGGSVASSTRDSSGSYTPSYSYGGGGSSRSRSTGGSVSVRGYYRKNGTYVAPHTRSAPRRR